MKVKLLYETHHRLRHQNRMNPVDRFVDAQYRNRLPNQQAHHLFVDTCLNKKSLIPRNLQTKKYNGGLATSPTIQFSEDGSIFACGDCSDFVQLWDVSKILVSRDMPNPVMFKYPDEVDCISLSPDKSHIFASCPNSQQIYIYDIFRGECIYVETSVSTFALRPNSDWNILVVGGYDRKIRIFDLRRSLSNPVLEMGIQLGCDDSIAISPANSSLVASAGYGGAELMDLRKKGRICSFPSPKGTKKIQFNGRGSRLLCIEQNQPVAVYDLTKADRNVYLTAPGYKSGYYGNGCFVGKDDELVASGQNEAIFIWYVPEDNNKDLQVVDEPLFTLNHGGVSGVCYNSIACALASCTTSFGSDSNVKFWTPLQLPPSYPLPDSDFSSFIWVGDHSDDDMSGTDDSNNSDLDEDVYDSEMSAESNSELSSEEDQEDEDADVPIGNNADGIAIEENEEDLIDFVGQVLPLEEEEDTQDAEVGAGEDDDNQEPIDLEEKSVIVSSASGRWQVL